jgi:hypothetical protein
VLLIIVAQFTLISSRILEQGLNTSYYVGIARSAVAGLTFWTRVVRFSSSPKLPFDSDRCRGHSQRTYGGLKGQTAIPGSRHRQKKQPGFQKGDEAKNERLFEP